MDDVCGLLERFLPPYESSIIAAARQARALRSFFFVAEANLGGTRGRILTTHWSLIKVLQSHLI